MQCNGMGYAWAYKDAHMLEVPKSQELAQNSIDIECSLELKFPYPLEGINSAMYKINIDDDGDQQLRNNGLQQGCGNNMPDLSV